MVRCGRQFVWALAACAALAAQATPQALCLTCDHPCCAAQPGGSEPTSPASETASTSGCTLCVAHGGLAPTETNEQPCNCQLDARQEQPLSLSRSSFPHHADDAQAIASAVVPPTVPESLGISREYVAASLAVPIRPARILFGVWRN